MEQFLCQLTTLKIYPILRILYMESISILLLIEALSANHDKNINEKQEIVIHEYLFLSLTGTNYKFEFKKGLSGYCLKIYSQKVCPVKFKRN